MTLSASFDFSIQEIDDFFWYDTLSEDILPYRMQNGLAGSWFHFTNAAMMQTLEQLGRDALMMRQLKYNNNLDEAVLGHVGSSLGFLRYRNETNNAYRDRVLQYWDNARFIGTDSRLGDELVNAGLSGSIKYNLPAVETEVPAVKGGSSYNIQPYPATADGYWSQFSVYIDVTELTEGTGSLSNLVTDDALADIRAIIKTYKPVDWVCREIILVSGSAGEGIYYDGDPSGLWDGTFLYADTAVIVRVSERHRASI